jgi:hypothetical protein
LNSEVPISINNYCDDTSSENTHHNVLNYNVNRLQMINAIGDDKYNQDFQQQQQQQYRLDSLLTCMLCPHIVWSKEIHQRGLKSYKSVRPQTYINLKKSNTQRYKLKSRSQCPEYRYKYDVSSVSGRCLLKKRKPNMSACEIKMRMFMMAEGEEYSSFDFVNVSILDTLLQNISLYTITANLQNSISCKLSLSNLVNRKACTIQILMDHHREMSQRNLTDGKNMIDASESTVSLTSVHLFHSLMESSYDWRYSSVVLNNPKLLIMFKALFLRFKSIHSLHLSTNEKTPKSILLQTSINRKVINHHHHYDGKFSNITPVLL